MKDTFKTFPKCEDCETFKRTKTSPNRALICETTRATGLCPKDVWKKSGEEELRKNIDFLKDSGSPKLTIVELEAILGDKKKCQ